jgi:hypothetical protein
LGKECGVGTIVRRSTTGTRVRCRGCSGVNMFKYIRSKLELALATFKLLDNDLKCLTTKAVVSLVLEITLFDLPRTGKSGPLSGQRTMPSCSQLKHP